MGLLFSKTRPPIPATVATDTIIPLHFMSQQQIFRDMTLTITLKFEEVLDAGRLYSALERLLEIGDWRRLGGRLRQDAQGNLSYHVPEEYNEKRPGFSWSHVEFNVPISEHAVASKLPSISENEKDRPQIFPRATGLESLIEPPDMPRKLLDWTSTDRPPLTIHVVSFKDATLMTVNFIHSFTDAMGFAAFLRAWTAVLAGQEDQVPTYICDDPIEKICLQDGVVKEKFVLYDWALKGPRKVAFILSQIWEVLRGPALESKTVAFPNDFVERLKRDAQRDLLHVAKQKSDTECGSNLSTPFLSEGDVIAAWTTKAVSKSVGFSSSRPIGMNNILEIRGIFPDILPANHAYLGNMAIQVFAHPSAGQLKAESLGTTALQVRRALEQQRTREQVEGHLAAYKDTVSAGGIPVFSPWNAIIVGMSNWQKVRLFEIDFSPAVASTKSSHASTPCHPSYIQNQTCDSGMSSRNFTGLVGKDPQGTRWMWLCLKKSAWREFERIARS